MKFKPKLDRQREREIAPATKAPEGHQHLILPTCIPPQFACVAVRPAATARTQISRSMPCPIPPPCPRCGGQLECNTVATFCEMFAAWLAAGKPELQGQDRRRLAITKIPYVEFMMWTSSHALAGHWLTSRRSPLKLLLFRKCPQRNPHSLRWRQEAA